MADDIKLSTNRLGTGRLVPPSLTSEPAATPAISQESLSSVKKAKTDMLRLSPEAATPTGGALDVAGVKNLAQAVGTIQNERKLVAEYQQRIESLVPGGVTLETHDGAHWASHELKNLAEVIEAMSPTDRQALSGMTFVRAGKIDLADGGSEAIAKQFGSPMGEVAQEGAGAVAQMGPAQEKGGFVNKVKDFVLQSAEVMSGIPILRFFGKALKELFGQKAPERAIVFGNAGTLISKDIFAHEIGHQIQMANRGWNPEKIAEFGKLSGWTETYGDKEYRADGVDNRSGERMLFNEQLHAKRTDNFVTKYAMTNPTEDFAESYRVFTTEPQKLMELAPDKFLYLNSQSQRYSAAEIKGFAQRAGQDLDAVATELALNSGLKQETLTSIFTVNEIAPDRASLVSEAASQLSGGDPLGRAWARIASEGREPASAKRFLEDPAAAFGDLWAQLSPEEQEILSDRTFMQARLDELHAGFASARSLTDSTQVELHRHAIAGLMDKLLNDPGFQQGLVQDPASTLAQAGLDTLPSEVQEAFSRNPRATETLVRELGEMIRTADSAQRKRYVENLDAAIPRLSPEHFSALAMVLNNADEARAAKVFRQTLETGSVIYQGGGDPPFP